MTRLLIVSTSYCYNVYMKIKLFINTKDKTPDIPLKSIEKIMNSSLKISTEKYINLIISPQAEIIRLNKQIFGRECSTDVISVYSPINDNFIGDVYICPDVIRENASKYNERYNIEIIRIIIHGILHLLGFDHDKPFGKEKSKLFKLQEQLLNKVLKFEK